MLYVCFLQRCPACLTLRARRRSTALSSRSPPPAPRRLSGRRASLSGVSVSFPSFYPRSSPLVDGGIQTRRWVGIGRTGLTCFLAG